MPDDKRLDLDVSRDFDELKRNLLDDVQAATELAKQRKAKDKARDAELQQKTKDRTIMYAIVAVAAVIIFGLAYWLVFARNSESDKPFVPAEKNNTPVQMPDFRNTTTPSNNATKQPGMPAPPRSTVTTPGSPVQTPPSEPVRRNPSESYDEGPFNGGM